MESNGRRSGINGQCMCIVLRFLLGFPTSEKQTYEKQTPWKKDSFLSFDEANKFVQLLTTLSTTKHGNHSGEILALRGGSLGRRR